MRVVTTKKRYDCRHRKKHSKIKIVSFGVGSREDP